MKRIILILICGCATQGFSQIQQGLRLSNYGGINSIQLNPSSFHKSPLKWDFNLISGGLFFENEYAFVENTSFTKLLNHNGPLLFRSSNPLLQEVQDDPDALYYNFFDAQKEMDQSLNMFLGLPSLAFRINDFSFGFYSNIRFAGALNNLDKDLDQLSVDQWAERETKSIDKSAIAAMLWGEIAINSAMEIKDNERRNISIGVNLKYLMGLEGFYGYSSRTSMVTEINDTLFIQGGPFYSGISSSLLSDDANLEINGHGWGIDLGVTYYRKSYNRSKPYLWKVAASLIDLGYVKFDENAQAHTIDGLDTYDFVKSNLLGVNTVNDLYGVVSNEGLGNANSSLTASTITLFTPLTLSVQFDYSLNKEWFVSGLINRRLSFHPKVVKRENLSAIALRYEKKWFEMGLPVNLVDDQHLRVGFWVRYYILTIGSDHVNSLLINQSQFTGSDIYFALKINPFSTNRSSGPEDCNFL